MDDPGTDGVPRYLRWRGVEPGGMPARDVSTVAGGGEANRLPQSTVSPPVCRIGTKPVLWFA